ncbi:hypothetical protein QMO56_06650 [Roseomonas sp. E05]|uniref:hypothetical protein n=1 Tax=Roseomonas sp. E05 TaxID=3046310 RepID=UPI0024BAE909|nr:hypothetical protein [Roseomonas sp. E05]MDJ0387787.1 hypothetical protein [Roseomonas sp. E05]
MRRSAARAIAPTGTILAGTMIPEAFEAAHDEAGLITVAGFLLAFALAQSRRRLNPSAQAGRR